MIAMLWTGIALKFKDQAASNYRDAVLNTQNLALLFEENVLRTVGELDKVLYFMRRQVESSRTPILTASYRIPISSMNLPSSSRLSMRPAC